LVLLAVQLLLGNLILKLNVYQVTIATLISTATTVFCEISSSLLLRFIFDYMNLKQYTLNNLHMALVAVPSNLMLITIVSIIYFKKTKYLLVTLK